MLISFINKVKFHFLAQFPADHLSCTVVSSLLVQMSKFTTFAYYGINRFVFVTTKPSLAFLLRIIDFGFDRIGRNGVILAASNIEQVLGTTPHKTPTLAPHHENYTS